MKIEYANLSKAGVIYKPREALAAKGPYADHVVEFLDQDRDFPEIIGNVPNLIEFAMGVDCHIGAFEIKAQESRNVYLPRNIDFLFQATALIIDDLYHTAGSKAADQCQVSLQFFRRDYAQGEPLLFDKIHRHAAEGKMVIYVATAIDVGNEGDPLICGTEFYAEAIMGREIGRAQCASSVEDFSRQFAERGIVAAPGGAIIRFGETTLHAAPDVVRPVGAIRRHFAKKNRLRRSLLNIIASYKDKDGNVYGRSRPPNDHRASPVVPHLISRTDPEVFGSNIKIDD